MIPLLRFYEEQWGELVANPLSDMIQFSRSFELELIIVREKRQERDGLLLRSFHVE